MTTLPVPGTVLDYRVVGDGPLLVLVAGARGAGDETGHLLPHRLATAFASRLGAPLHVLPGGHVGYLTRPAEFARGLSLLL